MVYSFLSGREMVLDTEAISGSRQHHPLQRRVCLERRRAQLHPAHLPPERSQVRTLRQDPRQRHPVHRRGQRNARHVGRIGAKELLLSGM